jgi:hypothetical protein
LALLEDQNNLRILPLPYTDLNACKAYGRRIIDSPCRPLTLCVVGKGMLCMLKNGQGLPETNDVHNQPILMYIRHNLHPVEEFVGTEFWPWNSRPYA